MHLVYDLVQLLLQLLQMLLAHFALLSCTQDPLLPHQKAIATRVALNLCVYLPFRTPRVKFSQLIFHQFFGALQTSRFNLQSFFEQLLKLIVGLQSTEAVASPQLNLLLLLLLLGLILYVLVLHSFQSKVEDFRMFLQKLVMFDPVWAFFVGLGQLIFRVRVIVPVVVKDSMLFLQLKLAIDAEVGFLGVGVCRFLIVGVAFGPPLGYQFEAGSVDFASIFYVLKFGEGVFLKLVPVSFLFHQVKDIFGQIDFR